VFWFSEQRPCVTDANDVSEAGQKSAIIGVKMGLAKPSFLRLFNEPNVQADGNDKNGLGKWQRWDCHKTVNCGYFDWRILTLFDWMYSGVSKNIMI